MVGYRIAIDGLKLWQFPHTGYRYREYTAALDSFSFGKNITERSDRTDAGRAPGWPLTR